MDLFLFLDNMTKGELSSNMSFSNFTFDGVGFVYGYLFCKKLFKQKFYLSDQTRQVFYSMFFLFILKVNFKEKHMICLR